MPIAIRDLDPAGIDATLDALSRILAESVNAGAAIGFMAPMLDHDAAHFWRDDVRPEVARGRRIVFGALHGTEIVGTVQLLTAMPPNQPHRAEIAKMIVHPRARRLGIGRALMLHAIARAESLGKMLLTLDTRTGDPAAVLYASVGFEVAGVIPGFACDPDGAGLHSTTYMFCTIGAQRAVSPRT
jgi:GNAT superfamily N-acetyltransferase